MVIIPTKCIHIVIEINIIMCAGKTGQITPRQVLHGR